MNYMDGTPVEPAYERAISKLVADACAAEELLGPDELERKPQTWLCPFCSRPQWECVCSKGVV